MLENSAIIYSQHKKGRDKFAVNDLFIDVYTRDKREQLVAQCDQGGRIGGVTHRWRVVHIDADGALGGEAILGICRPHFIGRCKDRRRESDPREAHRHGS
jgi:hypothetical protein